MMIDTPEIYVLNADVSDHDFLQGYRSARKQKLLCRLPHIVFDGLL